MRFFLGRVHLVIEGGIDGVIPNFYQEVPINESQNYISLLRVQAKKL